MQGEIRNKVAESTLVNFDLEKYYHQGKRVQIDIKDNLYNGFVLREKEFREFVKNTDWAQYNDQNVAIHCSNDAIVPTWAFMLLSTALTTYTNMVVFGDLKDLENALFQEALGRIEIEEYRDAKVIVKGCGHYPVPEFAYVEITRLLQPVVSSLMYGEACSAVPLYKKPKTK